MRHADSHRRPRHNKEFPFPHHTSVYLLSLSVMNCWLLTQKKSYNLVCGPGEVLHVPEQHLTLHSECAVSRAHSLLPALLRTALAAQSANHIRPVHGDMQHANRGRSYATFFSRPA